MDDLEVILLEIFCIWNRYKEKLKWKTRINYLTDQEMNNHTYIGDWSEN